MDFDVTHIRDRGCAATLLFALAINTPCYADVNDGLAAYKAGDYAKALSELQPAASQGNAAAEKTLALMYAIGQGVKEDDGLAISWWTKAAESGDAEAQWQLGLEYNSGERIKRDYLRAETWYRKAAEQGYGPAQMNLANMLTGGYPPIVQDRIEAARWLQLAADQNTMGAASLLGHWYSAGIGVPQDDIQAAYWWRRAAESSRLEFDSEANLGRSYELGRGVAQDYTQAFFWYQKAASMSPLAKQGLARLYAEGLGTQKNSPQALAIYNDLARGGWQDAQRHLAGMYERGEGVTKNLVIACAWYTLLATAKSPVGPDARSFIARTAPADALEKLDKIFADDARDAKASADRVAQELTSEQLDEAQKLALAWRPGELITASTSDGSSPRQ
jgi:TPR repeat protein